MTRSWGRVTTSVLMVSLMCVLAVGQAYASDDSEAGRGARGDRDVVETPSRILGDSQKPGRGDDACRSGALALTVDGGPNPEVTRPLVQVLQRLDLPATFFVVGRQVERFPAYVRRLDRLGYGIGNHTFTHSDMATMTRAQIDSEISATADALGRAGVRPSRYFRFPFGSRTPQVERYVTSLGYTVAGWTVKSRDLPSSSSAEIVDRVMRQLRARAGQGADKSSILLTHDSKPHSVLTVRAMPRIVRGARALGYCFSSLRDDGGTLAKAVAGP